MVPILVNEPKIWFLLHGVVMPNVICVTPPPIEISNSSNYRRGDEEIHYLNRNYIFLLPSQLLLARLS
jgi:hypothetical protein